MFAHLAGCRTRGVFRVTLAAGRGRDALFSWGGRGDLNPRPPEPQSGALTKLSYGHHVCRSDYIARVGTRSSYRVRNAARRQSVRAPGSSARYVQSAGGRPSWPGYRTRRDPGNILCGLASEITYRCGHRSRPKSLIRAKKMSLGPLTASGWETAKSRPKPSLNPTMPS